MRKSTAVPAALMLLLVLLGVLALGVEAARLPPARSLRAYLPAQPTVVPAQACLKQPSLAVPLATLLPLEPALRAAEGPSPRYASGIARSLICYAPRGGMLRYHLDEELLILEIRARFTRQEQFAIYLNLIYFGGDVPGAASSAQRMFQHSPDQLTVPQQALLMGMIRSPNRYDQTRNPPGALARRNAVLDTMQRNGDLTPEQAAAAKQSSLDHQFDHAS